MNLMNIAKAVEGGLVTCGPGTLKECGSAELFELFQKVFEFCIAIAGFAVIAFTAYAGVLMLISRGTPDKLEEGKRAFTKAVIGFVIVLSAWLIVNTIIEVFTNCTGVWSLDPFGGGNTFSCL